MNYVYVLNTSGMPLMPTTRYGKVRRMLKSGKATVVSTKPFTIRLLYEPETNIKQSITLGTDPGRTNIGVAAVDESWRCLYSAKCETRNKQIPKLMEDRAAHRRASRRGERLVRKRLARKLVTTTKFLEGRRLPGCDNPVMLKDIINTESRFNNRKKPEGWLTPTATQLLRTHLNLIELIKKILPVSRIVVELNKFAFMAMDNPSIQRWQYQKGPLHGYRNIREALENIQNGSCLLCGKSSIEHDHHIVPQSKGGSDTLTNMAGLCENCHTKVHTDVNAFKRLTKIKVGQNKKYHALSVLNQIIPSLLVELIVRFPDQVYVTTGMDTKAYRDENDIMKDHDTDAYCIACSTLKVQSIKDIPKHSFQIKQYRRHNRQMIHLQKERTYRLNGKIVAKNRRKRMDQKEPSLHEWYLETKRQYRRKETRRLQLQMTVIKSTRSYNDPKRTLPGAIFLYEGKRYVMSGQLSGGAYLRAEGFGTKNFPVSKTKIQCQNRGLVYVN